MEIQARCHGRAVAPEKNDVESSSDREHGREHQPVID